MHSFVPPPLVNLSSAKFDISCKILDLLLSPIRVLQEGFPKNWHLPFFLPLSLIFLTPTINLFRANRHSMRIRISVCLQKLVIILERTIITKPFIVVRIHYSGNPIFLTCIMLLYLKKLFDIFGLSYFYVITLRLITLFQRKGWWFIWFYLYIVLIFIDQLFISQLRAIFKIACALLVYQTIRVILSSRVRRKA